MRKRANFVLGQTALLVCGCLIISGVVGCGSNADGASGEYRDYSETEVRKSDDVEPPVITAGEPGHDLEAEEPSGLADGTPSDPSLDETKAAADDDSADHTKPMSAVVPAALEQPVEEPTEAEPIKAAATPKLAPEGTPVLTETGTREDVVIEAREPKLLVAEHTFATDRETRAIRVTYDDIDLLRILNMEPVPNDAADHFPTWLNELNGQKIRIRGFMYPAYKATGLTKFALARDNGICCFVREAKIYDLFPVKMAEGRTTDYIQNRPFDVVGTFHIDPIVEDGELFRLYRIDNARVIEK